MGNFTINSAAVVATYDPLIINYQLAAPITNDKHSIRITNGTANGANEINLAYPPSGTIVQPAAWNIVGFNPNQFRINSVNISLGTGASGTATITTDGVTVPSLPSTLPTNFGSPTTQYHVGFDGFTSGSTGSSVDIDVDFIDTVAV
jgi:hypothetical protein